jgi:hypothetical protein
VSATFREVDETMERDLFERRARAMDAPAGVPSLDAVLRAASEEPSVAVPMRPVRDESRERSGARARAWSGFALAAACVIAVMKTVSHDGVPSTIAADVAKDAGVSLGAGVIGASAPVVREEIETNECTGDHSLQSTMPVAPAAPVAPVATALAPVPEGPTCDERLATFESSATLSCDRDEAKRSEMP